MAKPKKKKSSAKKSAARKPRPARKVRAKKARFRKATARQAGSKKAAHRTKTTRRSPKSKRQSTESPAILLGLNHREKRLDPFIAQDTLRSRAEGSEASAFGMHQADAGSDAYDRDFALSLLSQEQDALYEIDEALKRIELGTYGKCEMSGKPIPRARLEAIPFARFTVECQSQLEKQSKASRVRQSVTSLFGLTEEEGGEAEEEVTPAEVKE